MYSNFWTYKTNAFPENNSCDENEFSGNRKAIIRNTVTLDVTYIYK
jgi:hypothetical protein